MKPATDHRVHCSICRDRIAILTVHLENGAQVRWCGACVDKVAKRVRAERSH